MTFLSVRDFRNNPLGANLAAYVGPVGDAQLYRLLDRARIAIETYVDVPLGFHIKYDEDHDILDQRLTTFPRENPVRALRRVEVIGWSARGDRAETLLDTTEVEATHQGRNPMVFGDFQVNRDINTISIDSPTTLLNLPFANLLVGRRLYLSYTAGYDLPVMIAASSTVASVASSSVFSLQVGDASYFQSGLAIRVGGQAGVVGSITGDAVTLVAPLSVVPSVGDLVTQGDGISIPPPSWLVELQRSVATHMVNRANANRGGANGTGAIRMGLISWTPPKGLQIGDLPDDVKEALDKRFGEFAMELA